MQAAKYIEYDSATKMLKVSVAKALDPLHIQQSRPAFEGWCIICIQLLIRIMSLVLKLKTYV
jgi:hypothetical protein